MTAQGPESARRGGDKQNVCLSFSPPFRVRVRFGSLGPAFSRPCVASACYLIFLSLAASSFRFASLVSADRRRSVARRSKRARDAIARRRHFTRNSKTKHNQMAPKKKADVEAPRGKRTSAAAFSALDLLRGLVSRGSAAAAEPSSPPPAKKNKPSSSGTPAQAKKPQPPPKKKAAPPSKPLPAPTPNVAGRPKPTAQRERQDKVREREERRDR